MGNTQPVIAFTGHRPDKLGGYAPNPIHTHVRSLIYCFLIETGPKLVISGMALGVDQWAVEECIYLGIPFVAAVPFVGQEKVWPAKSRQHYNELISKAARVVVVSPGGYSAAKMQTRNKLMVDRCDVLCAVWNGTAGGTANCVAYANSIGKKVVNLWATLNL